EVDGYRALVAVEVQERGREALALVAVGTGVVALTWLLHFDHVGTLIGQNHGRPGSRQHRGQVNDANAREWSHGVLVAMRPCPIAGGSRLSPSNPGARPSPEIVACRGHVEPTGGREPRRLLRRDGEAKQRSSSRPSTRNGALPC